MRTRQFFAALLALALSAVVPASAQQGPTPIGLSTIGVLWLHTAILANGGGTGGLGTSITMGIDQMLYVTSTAGAKSISAPPCNTTNEGHYFGVADEAGDAFTQNIMITPSAGNIGGAPNVVLNVNGEALVYRCHGATANWVTFEQAWPTGAIPSLSANQTWTGTNNFTGTFKIGVVTETFPGSGLLVGTTDTQTLTNKTFDCTHNTCVITVGQLAAIAANSMVANPTGSSAAPQAMSVPSCPDSGGNHLNWISGTGITCGTSSSGGGSAVFRSYLAGLTLSNDSTTPNSVLDIAPGVAADTTATDMITLGAFTKSTAGAWASGSGSNGMGLGLTIATSSWYDVCLAYNGGTPDIWFDTSNRGGTYSECANRPSGITDTHYRRIGTIQTDGSANILAFVQKGHEFLKAATNDVNVSNLGTTATLYPLAVPTGFKVDALIRGYAGNGASVLCNSPDEPSTAANSPVGNLNTAFSSANALGLGTMPIRTNTSGQVRCVASGPGTQLEIASFGWIDWQGTDN